MNKQELFGLNCKVNWYIRFAWGKPEEQENAQRANEQILSILTDGAYKSTLPDDRGAGSVPLPKIEPVDFTPPEWLEKGHFPIVGKRFSPSEFLEYCMWVNANEKFNWSPKGVTIHHTAYPDLSMRPDGFNETHMQNLRAYYKNQLGWSSGPHIFTDDNGIWVLTPLSQRGVHARSFNSTHIGIEMLGDFDYKDEPDEGRGKKSTDNGKIAAAAILIAFGMNPAKVNFHRDDPRTSKTCPGRKIKKHDFISDIKEIHSSITKK